MARLTRPWVVVSLSALTWSCAAQPHVATPQVLEANEAPQVVPGTVPLQEDDPHLFLEELDGERAMAFVRAHNLATDAGLGSQPRVRELEQRLRGIYDSQARIPFPVAMAGKLYNFWRDEAHPRGLWRRTSLSDFKKPNPAWETVLDLDALEATEQRGWVWQGFTCLPPKYERCLLSLSPGGTDAAAVREFDLITKRFVERGFELPAAKSHVSWRDLDSLYVGTDFGPGSLTQAGYPRLAKLWKRGTPLASAELIAEGEPSDVELVATRDFDHGTARDLVTRAKTFFTNEVWLVEAGELRAIDKPDDADLQVWNGQALLQLRSDWVIEQSIYKAGALLVIPLKELMEGKRGFNVLFDPTEHRSLRAITPTKDALLLTVLDDVKTQLEVVTRTNGGWSHMASPLPASVSAAVNAWDDDTSDEYFLFTTGFLTPDTLSLANAKSSKREVLKALPAFFDAKGLEVQQHFAVSKDGTRVPYFQVVKAGLPLDGAAPTVLHGYGGFEVSLTPSYDVTAGAAWVERGGVYVVANLRGGGEYGPAWHQAAVRRHRQKAFDDFAAVAADLIARKVTSPKKLGVIGGSNGGLLTSVLLTQHPELLGAVVSLVPLTDMKRFHLLLAGASWVEEYGDPQDPDDWLALRQYSPYQNVRAHVQYPPTLVLTSTRDDRVHPAHARKLVARLEEVKAEVTFFENVEGGHAGAADHAQRAHLFALAYGFLGATLGLP